MCQETEKVFIVLEGPGGYLDHVEIDNPEGEDELDLEVELVRAIQSKHWVLNVGDQIHIREGSIHAR